MAILPGFEYDIFISYRHNDNLDGWVTDFVLNLEKELKGTVKEPVSIYFDKNPHDGLLETHSVDKSLEGKLNCLIFIPIVSQTYCDPKSFAWQHEFVAFNKLAKKDQFGREIKLSNGNVASRILPIKIHELDTEDKTQLENELGGALRPVEFIYKTPGVNRPLAPPDNPDKNQNQTFYRDQINKVALGVKELLTGLKNTKNQSPEAVSKGKVHSPAASLRTAFDFRKVLKIGSIALPLLLVAAYLALSLVETLGLSNQEQLPLHKLFFPTILLAIAAMVGRQPMRKMGYRLMQFAAFSVLAGGIMDVLFTFSSSTLPGAHITFLQIAASDVSDNMIKLDFALLRALGTSLIALGLGSWALLHGPIKQGSKTALIFFVIMITLGEGNNTIQMYTLSIPFYIYTLTVVLMTWIGAVLWWKGDPYQSPENSGNS